MSESDPEPSPGPPDAGSPGPIRALARAVREGRATPEARARRRARRLADLVAFARRRSPLYARRYRRLPEGVDDLRRLPPITKPEAMDAFDDWITDPRVTRARVETFMEDPDRVGEPFLGRYLAMRTSGSTGRKAVHLHDPGARRACAALWATRSFPRWLGPAGWARAARRGFRTAQVLAVGEPFASHAYARFRARRHPLPDRTFSVLDSLPDLVAGLNAFDPAFLVAYPSTLRLLAGERGAGRLRADPAVIVSVSECLDGWTRADVEAAFGRPVRNAYAAAEHLAIAFDCREGRLHLNDDDAILEPVDDDLAPVPPGTPSSGALITNLSNRVQPVIRYLLTDAVVVEPDGCPCGSPLPAVRVDARRREILEMGPPGRTRRVTPMALVTVAESVAGVERYQLVQVAVDRLRIRLSTEPGAAEGATWSAFGSAVEAYLATQGVHDVRIERDPRPPRPDPASGKFHKVWCDVGEGWRG